MSKNRIVSSTQVVNSPPIYLSPDSPELNILDPRYVRIVTGNPNYNALPGISLVDSSVPSNSNFDTGHKAEDIVADDVEENIIQLDDIEKISGPTEYFVNGQKKFKFVIRIKNTKKLEVIGVDVGKPA